MFSVAENDLLVSKEHLHRIRVNTPGALKPQGTPAHVTPGVLSKMCCQQRCMKSQRWPGGPEVTLVLWFWKEINSQEEII